MAYLPSKTVSKASLPIGIIILVNVILAYLKSKGIQIDETIIWDAALAGYGALIALFNWIKNRKK